MTPNTVVGGARKRFASAFTKIPYACLTLYSLSILAVDGMNFHISPRVAVLIFLFLLSYYHGEICQGVQPHITENHVH